MRKEDLAVPLRPTGNIGRGERIRTCDPLLPKQMRYQTALRSEVSAALLSRQPVFLLSFEKLEIGCR